MSDSERAGNRSMGSSDGRRTSRRRFLRNTSVLSVGALAGLSSLGACSPGQATSTAAPTPLPEAKPTPAPATGDSSAWKKAFRERKSANAFGSQPLPTEVLLELLWAAWGVNRPDSGKRTAPSAMNCQEMDIYVLLAEGAYVYDAQGNKLAPVLAQDLRAKTGAMGAVRDAPVHLIYVADYDRMSRVPQSQKEIYSAAHSGFIGQNVCLFCAAAGLGTRFYASVDRAALKGSLKLRENQAVVFAQAVGYAK